MVTGDARAWMPRALSMPVKALYAKRNALIYCAGTEDCEFERLDKIRIVDVDNRQLDRSALHAGILRLQAKSVREPNAVYLSVPPGQHEVVIRFYLISRDKAERLHVIHQFNARQRLYL